MLISLLPILYVILFMLLIYRMSFFRLPYIQKEAVWGAFWAKIIAGIFLTYIYTSYYTDRSTADIFKYFDDSLVMYEAAFTHPSDFFRMLFGIGNDTPYFNTAYYDRMNWWYRESAGNIFNDSHVIIRFNTVFRFLSGGNFHVHTLFMCMISFSGAVALYRFLTAYISNRPVTLYIISFFIPSTLFWSSGLLKEGIVLFSIGYILYGLYLARERVRSGWIFFAIAAGLLYYIKFYLLATILPAALIFVFYKNAKVHHFLFAPFLLFLLLLALGYVFPSFQVFSLIELKQTAFKELAMLQQAGSSLYLPDLKQISDYLITLPYALYHTFILPFPIFSGGPLVLFSGIENLLFWLLVLLAFIFPKRLKEAEKRLIYFSIIFTCSVFLLIGYTVPVLGAIVRYKSPLLPFLYLIPFLFIQTEQVFIRLPFLKKIYEKVSFLLLRADCHTDGMPTRNAG